MKIETRPGASTPLRRSTAPAIEASAAATPSPLDRGHATTLWRGLGRWRWQCVFRVLAAVLVTSLIAGCAHPRSTQNRDRHGPPVVDDYIQRLTRPERVARLQPEVVIASLELSESAVVADLGAGPGVFAIPLGAHLRSGLVYAVDVEPRQLDVLRGRLREAGLHNVVPVLASHSDPHLPPGRIDLVLVVDTYHHIEDRVDYFRRLRSTLRVGGRLAILEYKPGPLPVGPPAEHKIPREVREAELRAAGYTLATRFDTHAYHDFEVWGIAGDP
jgi:SAM-dependent methyltransferase